MIIEALIQMTVRLCTDALPACNHAALHKILHIEDHRLTWPLCGSSPLFLVYRDPCCSLLPFFSARRCSPLLPSLPGIMSPNTPFLPSLSSAEYRIASSSRQSSSPLPFVGLFNSAASASGAAAAVARCRWNGGGFDEEGRSAAAAAWARLRSDWWSPAAASGSVCSLPRSFPERKCKYNRIPEHCKGSSGSHKTHTL